MYMCVCEAYIYVLPLENCGSVHGWAGEGVAGYVRVRPHVNAIGDEGSYVRSVRAGEGADALGR